MKILIYIIAFVQFSCVCYSQVIYNKAKVSADSLLNEFFPKDIINKYISFNYERSRFYSSKKEKNPEYKKLKRKYRKNDIGWVYEEKYKNTISKHPLNELDGNATGFLFLYQINIPHLDTLLEIEITIGVDFIRSFGIFQYSDSLNQFMININEKSAIELAKNNIDSTINICCYDLIWVPDYRTFSLSCFSNSFIKGHLEMFYHHNDDIRQNLYHTGRYVWWFCLKSKINFENYEECFYNIVIDANTGEILK